MTNITFAGQWRSDFVYDGLNRRRIARDFSWSGSAWVQTNEVHSIYDGRLLIQERGLNNSVLVSYTRGLDLGGSLQLAGGIGGLLARTDTNGSTFYHADGAGNITTLIDGAENIVARYLYNPFGKLTGQWGSLAPVNVMQFSSKPIYHGMVDFGLRWYSPDLDRWLNRDPFGERGGINLYDYVRNRPIDLIDFFGLAPTLDLMKPGSSDDQYAPNYPTDNSVYSVFSHGDPQFVYDKRDGSTKPLTADALAALIKKDPNYTPGKPVKLISCNTGTGKNSLAQQLANDLGANVYAPQDYAGLDQNGNVYVGPQAAMDGGVVDTTKNPSKGLSVFSPTKP